ncbi:MAG: hypothetical protein BMS9Abin26_1260 [Gammaproteobacteria bacterium]|nr:MAG: hypothetical protein BMS9Abin26_1260 [Gammaproteobacteria bacterium]
MHTMTSDAALGEGLVFKGLLPITWVPLESPLTDQQVSQLNASNEKVLSTIAALEEYPVESGDSYSSQSYSGQGHELARLDFKVNLLMDLVSQMLSRHLQLPSPTMVSIDARGLTWGVSRSETPPQAEATILLSIYLNSDYPRAVELPSRVQSVDNGSVRAEYLPLGDALREALEKLIFRHHRRSIAQARHPAEHDL